MSMQSRFASLASLALFVTSFSISTYAADPMGSVVAVEGRPTAAGPSGSRALSAGSDVFEGDTITVGEGNAQMQLDDGTKLVVGPSSRLILQAYLRRNNTTAKKVGLKALRGTFRVITGNSPKAAYDIRTNNATIGIRGTGFDIRVDNRTLLAVLEGAVRLRGSNGQAVNTKSGCGVAEAGPNSVVAKELKGTPKSDALQNELPYVVDQSSLNSAFHLPIQNCLISFGNNNSTPSIQPQLALPLIPAIGIPGYLIMNGHGESPVSAEAGQCTPVVQDVYYSACPNVCLPNCGFDILPGQIPFCDRPEYPVPCSGD
jgi:FecR protein